MSMTRPASTALTFFIVGSTLIFGLAAWLMVIDHRAAHPVTPSEDPRYDHIDLNCYITRDGDTASAVVMDPDCRAILSKYCEWYPGPSTAMDMP